MRIRLIRSKDVKRDQFDQVYDLLIHENGPAQFIKENATVSFEEATVSWREIFEKCSEYRLSQNFSTDDFVILLTSKENEHNWFSCPDPSGTRSIFIHTGGWDNYLIDCEARYPLAFQCWENLLFALAFRSFDEIAEITHDPPIGCIADMCSWKPHIIYKLRTADICRDCLALLSERGVSKELVKQALSALESLRRQMLFSREFRTTEAGDDKLPFTMAVTRRKINSTMEPLRKFLLLIDHFDSLIRTSVIFIGAATLNGADLANFFRNQKLDERPSLGDWVQALRQLRSDAPVFRGAALPNDLFDRINKILAKAEKANIVKMRNERRGHGYLGLHDTEYREVYDEYSPIVKDIEDLLIPIFARLNCYYVINSEKINDIKFLVTVKSLMGSYPDFSDFKFTYKPYDIKGIPYSNQCYLYLQNEEQWISLHPYLQFKICPECDHARILITDGKSYLDPYIGHRVII